jgi:PKD repeat protein
LEGFYRAVGKYCSLKLDSRSEPHISYLDASNNYVKYAHGVSLTPDITAATVTNSTNGTILFNDFTQGSSPVIMWNWSFGDGTWYNTTSAFHRNATKIYPANGTYPVSLTVRAGDITSSVQKDCTVTLGSLPTVRCVANRTILS